MKTNIGCNILQYSYTAIKLPSCKRFKKKGKDTLDSAEDIRKNLKAIDSYGRLHMYIPVLSDQQNLTWIFGLWVPSEDLTKFDGR